jgi:hypothetical protein
MDESVAAMAAWPASATSYSDQSSRSGEDGSKLRVHVSSAASKHLSQILVGLSAIPTLVESSNAFSSFIGKRRSALTAGSRAGVTDRLLSTSSGPSSVNVCAAYSMTMDGGGGARP